VVQFHDENEAEDDFWKIKVESNPPEMWIQNDSNQLGMWFVAPNIDGLKDCFFESTYLGEFEHHRHANLNTIDIRQRQNAAPV